MYIDGIRRSKLFDFSTFAHKRVSERRFIWVDYIRGIAIVLVVYRHVLIGLRRSGFFIPEYLNTFNMIFFSFRMPLFFLLSGMFISKSIEKNSFGVIARTKLDQLIYPYFVWASLQILLQIFASDYTNSSRGVYDFLYLFYNPRAIDQFWYLPALFNATVVFVLLEKIVRLPFVANLAIALYLYLFSYEIVGLSMLTDWMNYYIFFVVGHGISGRFLEKDGTQDEKLFHKLVLVIPVFFVSQWYYLSKATGVWENLFVSIVGCYFIYLISILFSGRRMFRLLPVIGYYSLYIYCMHVVLSAGLRIAMVKLFHVESTEILLILGILFSVFCSILVYNIAIRSRYLQLLFYPKMR